MSPLALFLFSNAHKPSYIKTDLCHISRIKYFVIVGAVQLVITNPSVKLWLVAGRSSD